MKYLCLIYNDEKKVAAMPADEVKTVVDECLVHTEELEKSGHYIAGERLDSTQTATTVRHGNGRVSVIDGPFAETKEQLAGFYMIEARDLNEAIRIASHIPPGRLGAVEVRPVMENY